MAFDMSLIRRIRHVGLRVVFVFGIIEAILSIALIIAFAALGAGITGFLVWTMIVSILTSLFLFPLTFMERFNKASSRFGTLGKTNLHARSAFISTIAGELLWTGITWVLWISAASISGGLRFGGCGALKNPGLIFTCFGAGIMGLIGWITWAGFSIYFWLILILSIIQHTRGNKHHWGQTIADADLFAPAGAPPPNAQSSIMPIAAGKPSYASSIGDASLAHSDPYDPKNSVPDASRPGYLTTPSGQNAGYYHA